MGSAFPAIISLVAAVLLFLVGLALYYGAGLLLYAEGAVIGGFLALLLCFVFARKVL